MAPVRRESRVIKENKLYGVDHRRFSLPQLSNMANLHRMNNADLLHLTDPLIQHLNNTMGTNSPTFMSQFDLTLFVEIVNGDVSFKAGSSVKGHIYFELGEGRDGQDDLPFGRRLNLYLKGFEETEFGSATQHCGRGQIISEVFPIAEWRDDKKIKVGKYAFPFEIVLPEWLPASLCVAEPDYSIYMAIKYMLVAQIEDDTAELIYVARNSLLNLSLIRHERSLIVTR